MILRAATWDDIVRFEAAQDGHYVLDWPFPMCDALVATFSLIPLQVIEYRGRPLLIYGSDGEWLTLFPSQHVRSHPIAFARATLKAYAEHQGSGLKCRVRKTEERVIAWARWLGVQLHPFSETHLEVVL
ncbi:MAG: hypothetical protein JWO52_3343 [Gammaproteobacteria bacterium]|nr:hypothetical protein [Gammaproteobacteria bacterium]